MGAISPRYLDDIKSIFYRERRKRRREREKEGEQLEISQRCFRRFLSARRGVSFDSATLVLEYGFIAPYTAARRISFSFYTFSSTPLPNNILSAKIAIDTQRIPISMRRRKKESVLTSFFVLSYVSFAFFPVFLQFDRRSLCPDSVKGVEISQTNMQK